MQDKLFKKTFNHSPNPMAKQNWIFVTSVSHYRHPADDIPFYRESSQGFQMFYTVAGQGWLDYEGSYQKIVPGTITCVDLEKSHGFGAAYGSTWEHYWLICHGKPFQDIYSLLFNKNNVLPLQNTVQILDFFKQLYQLKQNSSVYFDIEAMSIILQICSAALNQSSVSNKEQNPFSASLKHTIEFINKNYAQELDIAALAENANYSRFHFSRLFKAHIGFSPSNYITKIRLEKAKDLLKKSDLSLEIVAEKSGFNTVSYFIRTFKEWEGSTPGKYRKMNAF
jgi:AraC-like DNA-binding protein